MSLNRRSFFRALAGAVCTVAGVVYGVSDIAPFDIARRLPHWIEGVQAGWVCYVLPADLHEDLAEREIWFWSRR